MGMTAAVVACTAAAPASADQTAPTWNCRASVLQLFGSTAQPRFEPLVANGDGTTGGDRAACAEDREGLPEIVAPAGSPVTGSIQGPFSGTAISPAIGAARDQVAAAGTKAADVSLTTADGQLTISATAISAAAAASCVDGAPKLDGTSTVENLAVNGQALPLDDATIGQITSQLNDSPFGGLIKVLVNQKIATADTLTVQAVRIELFDAVGTPQGVLVLGEAKVARQGDTCAPAQPATTDTGSGTGTGTGSGGGSTGSTGSTGTTGSGGNPATSGSSTKPTSVQKVVINGKNGGCGRLKMWVDKVDLVHQLPGHPHRATARFGQRPMLRGTIVNCKGKPIVGARIDQIHVVGHGVGRLLKTGLRSRPGGKLTLILPMNLTTRNIVLRYRGNLASKKVTSRVVIHMVVRNSHGRILRGHPPRSLHAAGD